MKMDFIYTLAVTAALSFCSCTEIEDGAPINFDEWEAPEKIEFTLNHPCMLHSEADFTYVKEKLAASAQPWADAYASLDLAFIRLRIWMNVNRRLWTRFLSAIG